MKIKHFLVCSFLVFCTLSCTEKKNIVHKWVLEDYDASAYFESNDFTQVQKQGVENILESLIDVIYFDLQADDLYSAKTGPDLLIEGKWGQSEDGNSFTLYPNKSETDSDLSNNSYEILEFNITSMKVQDRDGLILILKAE